MLRKMHWRQIKKFASIRCWWLQIDFEYNRKPELCHQYKAHVLEWQQGYYLFKMRFVFMGEAVSLGIQLA